MVRFLVTTDWQLGMTRKFLDIDAQARFSDARSEAITKLGEIAASEACDFVVVAGDVFESNQVDTRTVERALDRLRGFPVPVYPLPGNHDPLDPSSTYRADRLGGRFPDGVHVLRDASPVPVDACIDTGSESQRPPMLLAALDAGLADGRYHFVALGDRHSLTDVGTSGQRVVPGDAGTHALHRARSRSRDRGLDRRRSGVGCARSTWAAGASWSTRSSFMDRSRCRR